MSQTGTRTVLFGQGDVNGIITPLIPFNCIYDVDFGLVRYMYENGYTQNDDLLDPGFFAPFKGDVRKIIAQLYQREDENPLTLFLRNNNDAEELYLEFLQKHYERIIRSSVHTGIYELCVNFKNEKSIKAGIVYSSEAEYYMLSTDDNLSHIELIDIDNLKPRMNEFNSFFFRSTNDFYLELFSKFIKSSSIFFLDYNFNLDSSGVKRNTLTAALRVNRNEINIINTYDHTRLGMEET